MMQSTFNRLAGELFCNLLHQFGFTNQGSQHLTYYRTTSEGVYHVVAPSLGRSGTWYCVRVFPHSPHIDPQFDSRFPDRLGIPTDSWSCLSEHDGVNLTQQQFNCKSEENLRKRFERTVAPLLANVALPYLDQFQAVPDILPVIRHSSFLGFALHHLGRTAEAEVILRSERERLIRFRSNDPDVTALLGHVERFAGLNVP